LAHFSQGKLTHHEGMHQHPTGIEQVREHVAASAQMIDPD
jgi:hypothetical protein